MSNHISLLLEAEAAKRRLAQSFQSEELDRATHQSTAIVTRDSSGAAWRDSKQNSKMSQENRRKRTPARSRTRTAIPTIGSGDIKRDLTVSSFMLALVVVGVVVAAHTDHPVFWLLVGPTPIAVLHTTRTFLRQRVIRREGPLMFWKRDHLYQETLLTENTSPIDAASKRLHIG
jgi:Flp pilus assembly protein TadB